MANTVVTNQSGIITITGLDADFEVVSNNTFARGIWMEEVLFTPGAAGDKLLVRDGLTGDVICKLISDSGQQLQESFGGRWIKAAIDVSECTFSTGAQVTLKFNMNKSLLQA